MAKQYKLKFKPTPISRLSKMRTPLPMAGDPPWSDAAAGCSKISEIWKLRESEVYPKMLQAAIDNRNARQAIDNAAEEYERILEAQG